MVAASYTTADTGLKVLEAAYRCAARFGFRRTTLDDVAREAQISRQTVYRYFGTREKLFTAVLSYETEKFLSCLEDTFESNETVLDALEQGIAYSLKYMNEHPLLNRMMETEPEDLLPYLTINGEPLIRRASTVVTNLISRTDSQLPLPAVQQTAESLTRLALSYLWTPYDKNDHQLARVLAKQFCFGLYTSAAFQKP